MQIRVVLPFSTNMSNMQRAAVLNKGAAIQNKSFEMGKNGQP